MPRKDSDPLISGSGLFDTSRAAPAPSAAPEPLTVSQICARVRSNLDSLGTVSVVGEVSNFTARNHWYFSVKDAGAVLNCVMWEDKTRSAPVTPANGIEVVVTGKITYYPPGGRTQIVVDKIERRGMGTLQQRYEALVRELRDLGYFEESRKRPLPLLPRGVAVITSPHAAALQDVLRTAKLRAPFVRVLKVHVPVQGEGAANEIARAIRAISKRGQSMGIDAVIVTRGGGSLEDLWAFNERIVADAVRQCALPLVAAIGHETDTTIIELVADRRASTPTQAAMFLFPDRAKLAEQADHLAHRVRLLAAREVQHARQRVVGLQAQLRSAPRARLNLAARALAEVCTAFERMRPAARHALAVQRVKSLDARLHRSMMQVLRHSSDTLDAAQRQLRSLGPGQVLARGYSLTLDRRGRPVRRPQDAPAGAVITTNLSQGAIRSTVTQSPAAPSQPHLLPPDR